MQGTRVESIHIPEQINLSSLVQGKEPSLYDSDSHVQGCYMWFRWGESCIFSKWF
jgi:hypothetical protein